MGTITRSFANNITTSGVLLPASLNNNSISNVTAYNAAVATGNMVLISSQTASNSASISFTTGISSTYKEYQFWFINIKPVSDGVHFLFNGSTDSGSNYNTTKTTTMFHAFNSDGGFGNETVAYRTGEDLAQSTSFQMFSGFSIWNDAKAGLTGSMSLFNPASTTYVKHFTATCASLSSSGSYVSNSFLAGYMNTTSAVNAVQFKVDTGNFSGDILMYGIV